MFSAVHYCVDVSVDVVCEGVTASASRCDCNGGCDPFDNGKVSGEKAFRDKGSSERGEDEKVPDLGL